ncbi:hypothetical protein H0H92_012032 [Tricholoma furcatifolium]|nr:hypothetical protein H0H92_012032 [Tricholoma furcatifolium]
MPSFQRAKKLRQASAFVDLPEAYWQLAQLTGKVIHNTSFSPITSRDTCQNIVNLDLLQDLSEQHAILKHQPQKLEVWLNKTRHDHADWSDTADELAAWHHDQLRKRSDELAIARERRLQAVVRNLNAAGYGAVIEKMDLNVLRHHKLVRKTAVLTERVWRNIQHSLFDFMERVEAKLREERLLEQITRRRQLFAQYISDHFPSSYTLAIPISELSQASPIKTIIELTPIDQVVTLNDFPRPYVIHMLSASWQRQRQLDLVQIMRRSTLVSRATNVAHLDLATTFFFCSIPGNTEPLGQQDVLRHPSTFSLRHDRDFDYGSAYVARLFDDFQQEFWNFGGDRIAFHDDAFLAARSVVASAGFDPDTTTAARMDAQPFLFEYSLKQGFPPKWARIDRSDLFYITAIAKIVDAEPFFRCPICPAFGDAATITKHIRDRYEAQIKE